MVLKKEFAEFGIRREFCYLESIQYQFNKTVVVLLLLLFLSQTDSGAADFLNIYYKSLSDDKHSSIQREQQQ